jgi:hypothetical protein
MAGRTNGDFIADFHFSQLKSGRWNYGMLRQGRGDVLPDQANGCSPLAVAAGHEGTGARPAAEKEPQGKIPDRNRVAKTRRIGLFLWEG